MASDHDRRCGGVLARGPGFTSDNPISRNKNWAMPRAGFTPEETGKIVGGNYMRIFNAALT
jgi:hypothetical protein